MLALILATQLAAVQPAGDTVELEILADGSAEVPAEGFQITAMVLQDGRDVVEQLVKMEAPKRETCLPGSLLGFVGNEAFADEGEVEEESAQIPVDSGEADAEPRFPAPVYYSGIFASRDKAEQALKLIRSKNSTMRGAAPVLYECEGVFERAKLDALVESAKEAAALADALGMQVAGVTRIADESDQTTVALELVSMYSTRDFDRDTVKVTRRLKVVYLLRK